jgi:hypothetical protein
MLPIGAANFNKGTAVGFLWTSHTALHWHDPQGEPDVRYWHKADMLNALTNVRFWGESGQ